MSNIERKRNFGQLGARVEPDLHKLLSIIAILDEVSVANIVEAAIQAELRRRVEGRADDPHIRPLLHALGQGPFSSQE